MRARLIFVLAAAMAVQTSGAVTDQERIEVYRQFRELFDARRYQEALPFAEQLVAMTEEQYGESATALANPLTNVGTTYYRMKNYPEAEKYYLRSVELLESNATNADRQLIRPLHGLGKTYMAVGQYVDAALVLKRAVDLSRNLDGLFNYEQLAMLEPLIECYVALEQHAEAEKEHQYALRVAETNFGRSDIRMLGPLDRYARWLEHVGRYTSARLLHARALSIAERNGGKGSLDSVNPLLGIARTYRLEYINGSEEDPSMGSEGYIGTDINNQRLNPDGERALKLALQALDNAQTPDHERRAETLIELGDWYMTGAQTSKGIQTYQEAWKELQQAGSTAPLEKPYLLAYRPPAASVKRSRLNPEEAEQHVVNVTMTVTEQGRTADVVATSDTAPESMQRSVALAFRKARFRPRFENGQPVATPNVTFQERLLTRSNAKDRD